MGQRTNDKGTELKLWGSTSIMRLSAHIEEQWPSLKFMGLGCYFAWIWLCYNSTAFMHSQSALANSISLMYLLSTAALALVLIVAGALHAHAERLLRSNAFMLVMGAVAGLASLGCILTSPGTGQLALPFEVCCVLTGLATGFVALKMGQTYARLDARQAAMQTGTAFILAAFLYFTVLGVPRALGTVFVCLLPLGAILCSACAAGAGAEDFVEDVPCRDGELVATFAKAPLDMRLLARFVASIAIYSLITGLSRGFTTAGKTGAAIGNEGALTVICVALFAGMLFLVMGLLRYNLDIVKLYSPIVLVIVAACVIPITGFMGAGQAVVVGASYNVFVLVMWCFMAHLSNHYQVSAVTVFGFGRGASALGTTVGWFLGGLMLDYVDLIPSDVLVICIVGLALLTNVLVFNDSMLKSVVSNEVDAEPYGAAGCPPAGAMAPGTSPTVTPGGCAIDAAGDPAQVEGERKAGKWTQRCLQVAREYHLSSRETEVLVLLAKGNSIERVADELCVSFNTSKTHIRNVYVKLGVHSRQELIDLIGRP